MTKQLHVHFMGIGGSGIGPIAVIAKQSGFKVSGCDYKETSYSSILESSGIHISIGHEESHLEGVDILAVSPAIFDINPNHKEIIEARKRNILMTWQEFMGKYLQKDKFVLAISGTHGKSTTTILAGLTLEEGGLNPIVEAGTIYKPWGGGFRIADSDYFVCEADEFNCNFLHYTPSLIVINNIEMDHPEYFKDFNDFKDAFKRFIRQIKSPSILVVNEESQGIREVLIEMKDIISSKDIKVIAYYFNNKFDFPFSLEYKAKINKYNEDSIDFSVSGENLNEEFELGILGQHNVSNALGVLCASLELNIDINSIKKSFKNYKGIGRRTELVNEIDGIKIFDDYGHHPTAIAAVIDTLKKVYPDKKLYAVVEPHQISRLKLFPNEFVNALSKADESIVTKSFLGREINKVQEPVDLDSLVRRVKSGKSTYIEDFKTVATTLINKVKRGDIIIIFGAGDSYKLTSLINSKLVETRS